MTNGAQAAHPVVRWDGHSQSVWLRCKLEEAGLLSMAEVPATLHVSCAEPEVGVPPPPLGRGAYSPVSVSRGRPARGGLLALEWFGWSGEEPRP
jgi:hypothetical protein